jgi:hypothetical protein
MFLLHPAGPLILFVLAFATSCSALTAFQWEFANNFVSTSLTECQNMSLVVKSYNNDNVTFGVPPYYMRAIAIGGIPTIALTGSDRNALSWVVDQRAGSKLMLTMLDSNGSTGGVAPTLYGVIAGTDTSCLPSSPTSQFTVQANVTTSVKTCQPWGLTIKGGVQPYNISLVALDSPVVTNVTMGPLDDVFTFIDRADPNTQLAATVNDATGTYASGTPIVSTTGSSNVDCVGLVSTSGNSTQMAAQAAAQAAVNRTRARSRRRKDIIVGVVVGLVGSVVIVAAIICLMARSRRTERGVMVGQDTRPRLFEVEQAIPVTAQSDLRNSSRKALMANSPSSPTADTPGGSSSSGSGPNRLLQDSDTSASAHFPDDAAAGGSSPPGRRNKAVSAYMRATRSVGEVLRPALRRGRDPVDPDLEPDIIIQHRDGGVVQELPPPYARRH